MFGGKLGSVLRSRKVSQGAFFTRKGQINALRVATFFQIPVDKSINIESVKTGRATKEFQMKKLIFAIAAVTAIVLASAYNVRISVEQNTAQACTGDNC